MEEFALAELIAPISVEAPAGADVRLAGPGLELYLAVKDARAAARIAEREALAAGDPEIDPLQAGHRAWGEVVASASRLLAEQAKDLQVAAWLVEAWLRTDGLAGLADGLTLLAELIIGYWQEGLHPQEDEEEAEARLAPLLGLFGREEPGALVQPLKLLPLTDVPDARVALWTLETLRGQSIRHDDPQVREELVGRHAQRVARLESAVAAASRGFVDANLGAVDRALHELDRLMAAVDERTGAGRFGSQVTAPLSAIAEELRRQHGVAAGGDASPASEVADATDRSDPQMRPPSPVEPAPQQKGLDRRGALATLIEIAGFFDRTEPQSLIGQGLRELVRRANLPLDELIGELIPDRDQRAMFMLRAGIRLEPTSDGGSGFTTF
jgi:type VI secretion system protein ImpA